MGTPHQGTNKVQFGKIMVHIASLFGPANDRLLKNLDLDSEWLQQQLGQYGPISRDFVTKFAFEEYETPMTPFGPSIMVCGLCPAREVAVNKKAGCTPCVRCGAGPERRTDCHPRGPQKDGQIYVTRGQRIQCYLGTSSDHGKRCPQRDLAAL